MLTGLLMCDVHVIAFTGQLLQYNVHVVYKICCTVSLCAWQVVIGSCCTMCMTQCSQYELLYSVTLCMTSCYWELLYNVHDTLFTIWATVQCHFVCDKLLLGAAVQCAWHNVHNNSYRTVSVFTIIATVQCHFVRDKLLLGAAVQCAWHSVHNMLDTLLTGVEAPMDRPCSWWRMRSSRSWTPSEKMTLSTLWR